MDRRDLEAREAERRVHRRIRIGACIFFGTMALAIILQQLQAQP